MALLINKKYKKDGNLKKKYRQLLVGGEDDKYNLKKLFTELQTILKTINRPDLEELNDRIFEIAKILKKCILYISDEFIKTKDYEILKHFLQLTINKTKFESYILNEKKKLISMSNPYIIEPSLEELLVLLNDFNFLLNNKTGPLNDNDIDLKISDSLYEKIKVVFVDIKFNFISNTNFNTFYDHLGFIIYEKPDMPIETILKRIKLKIIENIITQVKVEINIIEIYHKLNIYFEEKNPDNTRAAITNITNFIEEYTDDDNEEDITDTDSADPYFRYGIAVSEKTL